jgi:hypothetical protein
MEKSNELIFRATCWACKDAITGEQRDGSQFRRAFPNGVTDALTLNKLLCSPLYEIDQLSLDDLEENGYLDIAAEELQKQESK